LAGKKATLSFTGIQVAWISTEGATQGSATVQLDGGGFNTINTNAGSTKPAEIVDVVSGKQGAHTLVISVLGTTGHPRIDIDAFVVLSD
jgi:hypothetical protein